MFQESTYNTTFIEVKLPSDLLVCPMGTCLKFLSFFTEKYISEFAK